MDFRSLMNKFRNFTEWHELSDATYHLLQSETSTAIQIKELLTRQYPELDPNPDFTNILETLKQIYTSVTKTNSSTAFMNSDLDHLFVIHDAFESRKTAMRDLSKALEAATNEVCVIHAKLISLQQGSGTSDEIMTQQQLYNAALQNEETCRRDHDEMQKLYEIEFSNYQSEFVQSLSALLGEVAKIRAMHDDHITGLVDQLTDKELSFTLDFSESDDQINDELSELRRLVAQNEQRMDNFLTVSDCCSDPELVLVTADDSAIGDTDTDSEHSDPSDDISPNSPYSVSVTVSNRY